MEKKTIVYFFVSPFFKIVPGDLEAVLEEVDDGYRRFLGWQ